MSDQQAPKSPTAMALTWCLACPSSHPLHRFALIFVRSEYYGCRFKRELAQRLGMSQSVLSQLLSKHPEIEQ